MINSQLYGLGTALVTPFKQDGEIDFPALDALVDNQIKGGADYLVVLGTTSEAATMTQDEKKQVINAIVKRNNRQLPLVLGLGGNNTKALINEIDSLKDILTDNFSAILSVCPYYNKPSQEGLYRHFKAVAEASPVPVILYNVPGRTGVNMLPETVSRLHNDCKMIAGVKEASGNVEQIERIIQLTKGLQPFLVISGDDGITAELMDKGAAGLISVASNAFPEIFHRIVSEHNHALQEKYANIVRLLFKEGNPSGIKTVLAHKHLIENVLRLPLVSNSQAVQDEIAAELNLLEEAG